MGRKTGAEVKIVDEMMGMGMPIPGEQQEEGSEAGNEDTPMLLVGGLGDPSDEVVWDETKRKLVHDFSVYGASIDSASPPPSAKGWIILKFASSVLADRALEDMLPTYRDLLRVGEQEGSAGTGVPAQVVAVKWKGAAEVRRESRGCARKKAS